jgi:hypothetical protein
VTDWSNGAGVPVVRVWRLLHCQRGPVSKVRRWVLSGRAPAAAGSVCGIAGSEGLASLHGRGNRPDGARLAFAAACVDLVALGLGGFEPHFGQATTSFFKS